MIDNKKTYALVIGIEQYKFCPLDGPAGDAVDFVNWLMDRGVPESNIVLITSGVTTNAGNASKAHNDTLQTIEQLYRAGKVQGGDLVSVSSQAGGQPTRSVTFEVVRHGIRKVEELCAVHSKDEDAALFVFGSGHGAIYGRLDARLWLEDYAPDDMQALDVGNLWSHFRASRPGGDSPMFPGQQLLVFSMCSVEEDTSPWIEIAGNSLQVGPRYSYGRNQSTLFACPPDTKVGLDPTRRRSEFWVDLKKLLDENHPIGKPFEFPSVQKLRTKFLETYRETYDVAWSDPSGSGYEQASKRRLNTRALVAIGAAAMALLMAGSFLFRSWWTESIEVVIARHVQAVDGAPSSPELSKASDDIRVLSPLAIPPVFRSWVEDRLADMPNEAVPKRISALFLISGFARSSVCEVFATSHDRMFQTTVIDLLGSSSENVKAVEAASLTALQGKEDADADRAYVLLLALVRLLDPRNATASKNRFGSSGSQLLIDKYRNHPDPGVHSALRLVLKQLYFDLKSIDEELSNSRDERSALTWLASLPRPTSTWYVTPQHMTMVIVPPGSFTTSEPSLWKDQDELVVPGKSVQVRHWFAIATMETVNRDFDVFAKHPSTQSRSSETNPIMIRDTKNGQVEPWMDNPEIAATRVTWTQAMKYCDWLSDRELAMPDGQSKVDPSHWIKFLQGKPPTTLTESDAYRLPMEGEWELACRAGSDTVRFYGDDDKARYLPLFAHYGKARQEEGPSPEPPGLRMPNRLGLFDTYGNVAEWCIDRPAKEMEESLETWTPPAPNSKRPLRGAGCDSNSGGDLFSSYRSMQGEESPWKYDGFRIARTLRFPSKSGPSLPDPGRK